MTEFYQTRMGLTFYEHTMPTIAKELQRLNAVLERIAAALDKPADQTKEGNDENHED